MALVLGTNSGFVTVAPTSDPASAGTDLMDNRKVVTHATSPSTAVKITEIGWWCSVATEEANFEVGLYAADGATVPGEAGTRLFVDDTNAKGTGAGWKTVSVDWTISPSTDYWLAVQLDNTATETRIDSRGSNGGGSDNASGTTLTDPFGGGSILSSESMLAIYAVWEADSTVNQTTMIHMMAQSGGLI